jgi:hypothetical protein
MIIYRILLAIDLAAAAILFFFFAWGLSDGTVSSFNMYIWVVMLAIPGLILWGGLHFGSRRQYLPAGAILSLLAAPCALATFGLVVLMIAQPNWH